MQRKMAAYPVAASLILALVGQRVIVPTTIVRVRSLPAPRFLPTRSRLRPVEATVWALDAILLRYKVEEDSDVHRVSAIR